MTGYIIEEPNETPIYYDDNNSINYFNIYSPIQRKRFQKVLRQMKDIWYIVFNQMKFMRYHISVDESNILMHKIHNMFIIEHKLKIEYYNDVKNNIRKNKKYLYKKINKIKNKKYKI